jgi:hypothetical protein
MEEAVAAIGSRGRQRYTTNYQTSIKRKKTILYPNYNLFLITTINRHPKTIMRVIMKTIIALLVITFFNIANASEDTTYSLNVSVVKNSIIFRNLMFISATNVDLEISLDDYIYPVDRGIPPTNKINVLINSSNTMTYEIDIDGCIKNGNLSHPINQKIIPLCSKDSKVVFTTTHIGDYEEIQTDSTLYFENKKIQTGEFIETSTKGETNDSQSQ